MSTEYDISEFEGREFEPTRETPTCECGEPVEHRGDTCEGCVNLALELEADEAWPVFLDSLKLGRQWVEQIDGALTGWKYAGGKIEQETTSKGVLIAYANNLLFTRGQHGIQYRADDGRPCFDLCHAGEHTEWAATFHFPTPLNIILAAIAAI